jgi:hypothetical protein
LGTQRNRSSAKRFAVEVALGGVIAASVAVGSAGLASADPDEPPPAPAPPPGAGLLAGPVDPNMIIGSPPPVDPAVQSFGPLGAIGGGGGPADYLLGQNPVPQAEGTPTGVPPNGDFLAAGAFLTPQNYRMPDYDPESLSPYALTDGVPGPFARIDAYKGAHAMAHGAIGRMPIGDLGQPLPGTAPPPGTNIPVGPVDGLPDPGAPPPPFLPPLPPLG